MTLTSALFITLPIAAVVAVATAIGRALDPGHPHRSPPPLHQHVTQQNANLNAPTPKLTIIVDTWVSGHYGDPHAEVHAPHSAA
ncbi:hypothetical protein [Streptomyces sp. NPDC059489]|uniref:hypothetical protein n=1 Tax=Streptomyces sp. NPDC059489 TaxID=3346849 RepID=UPI0036A090A6